MLSYQHIYHAGNMADVHKHLWLMATLHYLKQNKAPFTWLDTHAGRGLYDLSSKEAQKLGEYRQGFLKFRDHVERQKTQPSTVSAYLKLVDQLNRKRAGQYPGSALITAQMLRKNDRLEACELHKGEIEHLKRALQKYPRAKIDKHDGLKALSSLAAKKPCGGAIIDPSYEVKSEYEVVLKTVAEAHHQWPDGVFLVWYPLLPAQNHIPMSEGFNMLQQSGAPVQIEEVIWRNPSEGRGLYGSGMIIINGPDISFKTLIESNLH